MIDILLVQLIKTEEKLLNLFSAEFLRRKNLNVCALKVFDHTLKSELEKITIRFNPKLIIFHIVSKITNEISYARCMKNTNAEIIFMIPEIKNYAEILENSCIDYIVEQENIFTIEDLFNLIKGKKHEKDISGIGFKSWKNNKTVITPNEKLENRSDYNEWNLILKENICNLEKRWHVENSYGFSLYI